MRIIGASGLLMSVKFLVRNTTTSFAPSSRWASKYHHSYVPALPSVRAPSSQGATWPGLIPIRL
jgi:hypothetical protein